MQLRDISIQHGARDDIRRHIQSKKHSEIAKARGSSSLLNDFTKGREEEEMLSTYCISFTSQIYRMFCVFMNFYFFLGT